METDKLRAHLEADAAKMMQELGDLSAKLKALGSEKAGQLAPEALAQLNAQLSALQEKLQALGSDGQKLLGQVDKSVRANPYLYIAGALGIGVVLGKALRS